MLKAISSGAGSAPTRLCVGTAAAVVVATCARLGVAVSCRGGPVRGAPEDLAALGHGGPEVVPANICVQAVVMEVRWWCSPPLFPSRAVQIRRCCGGRARWLALYVLAVP
jgi:hypothetical protein